MANKVSSGLSGFLRLGVPCAAPGSALGGDGRLGAISAALALSSRNLSNSRRIGPKQLNKTIWDSENAKGHLSKCSRERGDLCCPTFTCHTFLTFISFLLGKKRQSHTWELNLTNLFHCEPPQTKSDPVNLPKTTNLESKKSAKAQNKFLSFNTRQSGFITIWGVTYP